MTGTVYLTAGKKTSKNQGEYHTAWRLKYWYGISLPEFNEMLEKQGGVCAICGKPETKPSRHTGKTRALCVDHNHQTGEVRGLLCDKCNRLLGVIESSDYSLETIQEMLVYLEKHNDK